MKLADDMSDMERGIAMRVLMTMLENDRRLAQNVLHPQNGQFGAGPLEAGRSYVRAFAYRHGFELPEPEFKRFDSSHRMGP